MTIPKPFNTCIFCNIYFFKTQDKQNICSVVCAFLSRVNKKDSDSCWPWLGASHKFGYGEFTFLNKQYRAHRFSLEYHTNKKLMKGEFALHKCDNPNCCNPNHLYKGTQWDNMSDVSRRDRRKKRLTKEQVIEIKQLLENGKSKNSIAKKFSVSNTTIYYIDNETFWKGVSI